MATSHEVMPSKFSSLQTSESLPLVSWEEWVRMITTDPGVKQYTEQYREQLKMSKRLADKLKASAPGITVSVQTDGYGRQLQNVKQVTHILQLDYDHVPPEKIDELKRHAELIAYTAMVYRTVSGKGLRIFVKYEACEEETGLSHVELFNVMTQTAMKFYDFVLGMKADRQCVDITRIAGVAHDPDAYFCWDSVPMEPAPELLDKAFKMQEVQEKRSQRTYSKRKGGKNAKRPHAGKGEAPTMEEAAEHVKQLLEMWGNRFEANNHNRYVTDWAYICLKYGIDSQEALTYATSEFGTQYPDTASVVNSVYKHKELSGIWTFYREGDKYSRKPSVKCVKQWLSMRYEFHRNILTGRYEIRSRIVLGGKHPHWTYIDDNIENSLWSEMDEQGLKVGILKLHAIINSDFSEDWDPLDDYLRNLPEWDGKDHIGQLADRVKVKHMAHHYHTQKKFKYYFRKWFVAMVVAWVSPKVVNQFILILIGKGGIYKTTFFNYLLPPSLRAYYLNDSTASYTDKDCMEAFSSKALICLDEFETVFGKNLSAFKSNITKLTFSIRRPYDKYRSELMHHASLAGTSNNQQIISDDENRRYSPWLVESIQSPMEYPIDYQQLYAQAVVLGKEVCKWGDKVPGDTWVYWLNSSDIDEMKEHNKMFMVANYAEEQILRFYNIPDKDTPERFIKFRYNAEILERICTNPAMRQNINNQSIGSVMARLGFKKAHKERGNGWWVIEKEGAQINQEAMFNRGTDDLDEEE